MEATKYGPPREIPSPENTEASHVRAPVVTRDGSMNLSSGSSNSFQTSHHPGSVFECNGPILGHYEYGSRNAGLLQFAIASLPKSSVQMHQNGYPYEAGSTIQTTHSLVKIDSGHFSTSRETQQSHQAIKLEYEYRPTHFARLVRPIEFQPFPDPMALAHMSTSDLVAEVRGIKLTDHDPQTDIKSCSPSAADYTGAQTVPKAQSTSILPSQAAASAEAVGVSRPWTIGEDEMLVECYIHGVAFDSIPYNSLNDRSAQACQARIAALENTFLYLVLADLLNPKGDPGPKRTQYGTQWEKFEDALLILCEIRGLDFIATADILQSRSPLDTGNRWQCLSVPSLKIEANLPFRGMFLRKRLLQPVIHPNGCIPDILQHWHANVMDEVDGFE
ncbi:hypothetical protein MMC13_002769 [Lambiella insularis]|nr:hypothetical protein [Lambiella insularis]